MGFVSPGTTIIILRSRCCWTLQCSSLRCPRTLVMLDGSKMAAQFCLVFLSVFISLMLICVVLLSLNSQGHPGNLDDETSPEHSESALIFTY